MRPAPVGKKVVLWHEVLVLMTAEWFKTFTDPEEMEDCSPSPSQPTG